ncbi:MULTISPECIES: hypothetical protein [Halorussus]|uniref:hypothetical protein n=1 Tax=Halorussus TaxID=1070314 RepID=UPI000E217E74|nr:MULTISPECIES: hypothetical protein [Halorussus]NHN58980.1 hypothetical protein [Halorussus sp. JP-T4]
MRDLLRRTGRFLDDHWVLKWFVAPVLFMATLLLAVALVVTTRPAESGQLVGLFVGFSLAVVAVGLALDWAVRRATGWNLLASNRDRG